MTAADPLFPETPEPTLARRDDLRLLAACACAGLCASGHGPPWLVPVWVLAYWLTLRSPDARRAAAGLPLLIALAGAWPLHSDPLLLTGHYLRLALVGSALYAWFVALDLRQMTGLLWLALVVLSAPTPLALLGLLGAAALSGAQAQRGVRVVVSRPALAWLAGAVLLVGALSVLLPPATGGWAAPVSGQRRAPTPPVVAPPEPGTPPAARPDAATSPRLRFRMFPDEGSLHWANVTAQLLMGALALLAITVLVWALRERVRFAGVRLRLADLILSAALLIGLGMVFLWALLLRQGAGNAGAGVQAGRAGGADSTGLNTTPEPIGLLGSLGWLLVGANLLFLAVIVASAVLLWRLRLARDGPAATAPSPPTPDPGGAGAPDRVRQAYRAALALLAGRGLGRQDAETPQEFARRVGGQLPGGAAALDRLTQLYQPVRYGRTPPDAHADQAEAALTELRAAFSDPAPPLPHARGAQ